MAIGDDLCLTPAEALRLSQALREARLWADDAWRRCGPPPPAPERWPRPVDVLRSESGDPGMTEERRLLVQSVTR